MPREARVLARPLVTLALALGGAQPCPCCVDLLKDVLSALGERLPGVPALSFLLKWWLRFPCWPGSILGLIFRAGLLKFSTSIDFLSVFFGGKGYEVRRHPFQL